jgi:hypothetical protein
VLPPSVGVVALRDKRFTGIADELQSRAFREVCDAGVPHAVINSAGAALPGPLELPPVDVPRRARLLYRVIVARR